MILAVGLSASSTSDGSERCMAASRTAEGGVRHSSMVVDLDQETRLNPADLPERTFAVMCSRGCIVPRPSDVRVLSEWRVPFGIAEQGPRSLWISAEAGRRRAGASRSVGPQAGVAGLVAASHRSRGSRLDRSGDLDGDAALACCPWEAEANGPPAVCLNSQDGFRGSGRCRPARRECPDNRACNGARGFPCGRGPSGR